MTDKEKPKKVKKDEQPKELETPVVIPAGDGEKPRVSHRYGCPVRGKGDKYR